MKNVIVLSCLFFLFSTLALPCNAWSRVYRLGYPANVGSPLYKMLLDALQNKTLAFDETIQMIPIDINDYESEEARDLIRHQITEKCDIFVSAGESLSALQKIRVNTPLIYVSLTKINAQKTSSLFPNGTGFFRGSHTDIINQSLQMLPEKMRDKIGIIYSDGNQFAKSINGFQKSLYESKFNLTYKGYKSPKDLSEVMRQFKSEGVKALLLFPAACPDSDIPQLAALQKKLTLPVIGQRYDHIMQGIFAGPTIDPKSLAPQVADYALKILRGRAPSQLPVKFIHHTYAINLMAASELEIEIPQEILAQSEIVGFSTEKKTTQQKTQPLKKGLFSLGIPKETSNLRVPDVINALSIRGYVEGKNMTVHKLDMDRVSHKTKGKTSHETLLSKADVIFTTGNMIPTLIQRNTSNIPICFIATKETFSLIPKTLKNNYTGVVRSAFKSTLANSKRIMKGKTRIAMLGRRESKLPKLIKQYKKIAAANGLTLHDHLFSSHNEIGEIMRQAKTNSDYILLFSPGLTKQDISEIVKWQRKCKFPVLAQAERVIKAGVLGGFVADTTKIVPKVAEYIDKLFQGRQPPTLPEYYYQGKYVINLHTANFLNLEIPPEVTAQAKIIRQPTL